MRFHSTVSSVDNFEFSILALLESIFAMLFAIWVAWTFQTNLHLFLTAFIAPFLLLRTDKSTEKGLLYFEKFAGFSLKPKSFGLWIAFTSLMIVICAYLFFGFIYSFLFFLSSSYVVFAYYVSISKQQTNNFFTSIGESRFLKIVTFFQIPLLAIIVATGMLFAIIIGSITIKIISTLIIAFTNPTETLKEVPNNWSKMFFSIDILHPPEILPGIEGTSTEHNNSMKISRWLEEVIDITKGKKGQESRILGFLFLLITPLIYAPAIFYRWSLKSTSLIWYPLIFIIGKDTNKLEETNQSLDYQLKKYSKTHLIKSQAFFSAFAIIFLTILPLLISEKFKAFVQSIPAETIMFEYFFAFQMNSWHWSRLIASILTLCLFFFASSLLTKREYYKNTGTIYAPYLIRTMVTLRIFFSIFTISCAFFLLYLSVDWQYQFDNIRWLPF